MAKRKTKAQKEEEAALAASAEASTETPKAEEPKAPEPKVEEPKAKAPEPKAEEPKAPEPKAKAPEPKAPEPKAKAETAITMADVMGNGEFDDGAKIVWLMENAPMHVRVVAAKLVAYNMQMKPGVRMAPELGAARQLDLYNTIESVINNPKYTEFKECMDAICLVYRRFKDESYGERYVMRFDLHWKQGEKRLRAFNNLQTVIIAMAKPADRAMAAKKIDLNRAFDIGDTGISAKAATNLKKYFKV